MTTGHNPFVLGLKLLTLLGPGLLAFGLSFELGLFT
jgi:hypothetical protein